jgi:DNA-directed RNA polymerase sigma subunit (sigma70/sigma32)
MKYKSIIEDLKGTGDPNVMAFLKDVARIKRLSKKERDYCLQNRWSYVAVRKLVEEFIPYIIWVAYAKREQVKTLSVLDLIDEGIIGAYKAFELSEEGGILSKRRVNNCIKRNMRRAIRRDHLLFVEEQYEEEM